MVVANVGYIVARNIHCIASLTLDKSQLQSVLSCRSVWQIACESDPVAAFTTIVSSER